MLRIGEIVVLSLT